MYTECLIIIVIISAVVVNRPLLLILCCALRAIINNELSLLAESRGCTLIRRSLIFINYEKLQNGRELFYPI